MPPNEWHICFPSFLILSFSLLTCSVSSYGSTNNNDGYDVYDDDNDDDNIPRNSIFSSQDVSFDSMLGNSDKPS